MLFSVGVVRSSLSVVSPSEFLLGRCWAGNFEPNKLLGRQNGYGDQALPTTHRDNYLISAPVHPSKYLRHSYKIHVTLINRVDWSQHSWTYKPQQRRANNANACCFSVGVVRGSLSVVSLRLRALSTSIALRGCRVGVWWEKFLV